MIDINNLFRKIGYVPVQEYNMVKADHDQIEGLLKEVNTKLDNKNKELETVEMTYEDYIYDTNIEMAGLRSQIFTLKNLSELDLYCYVHYKDIDDIAYTGKRKYLKHNMDIYLKEFITPNTYEVKKFFNNAVDNNTLLMIKQAGNRVAKHVTWKDDMKNLGSSDYYLYPNEIILGQSDDCEGHSYLLSSCDNRIGVAYGYLTQGKRKFGHAFNVFVYENELYIADTTGDSIHIEKYGKDSNYYIHYIITHNKSYELDGSVVFGVLKE